MGVDAFFVISGAVMTPRILRIFSTDDETTISQRLFKFYQSRFFRLAPAFATCLIASTILVFLFGNLQDHSRYAMQGIYSMLFVGNIGAARWSGNYFAPNQNPLVHLWSLSVEEQFYFVIPIAMLFFVILLKNFGFTNQSYIKIYTIFMSVLLPGSLLLFLNKSVNSLLSEINVFGFNFAFSESFSFYAPWQRIWEFAIGSVAFILWKNTKRVFSKIMPVFIVLLICLLNFPLKATEQKISTLIVCCLTAIIIVFGFSNIRNRQITNLFEKLGDYSYSIYLIHLPLIYIFTEGFFSRIGIPRNFCILVSLFLSIILGAINYRKIENVLRINQVPHIRKGIKNRSSSTIGLLLITAASLIVIDVGSNSHYWGLDKNIKLPTPAGYIGRNECAVDTTFGEPCTFASNASKGLVYLIGDSHAAELSKVVKEVALENGFSVAIGTHSGFPIAIHASGASKKYNSSLTYSNTQSTFDYIKRYQPSLVIISMNFAQWEKSEMERAILEIKSRVPNVLIVNQTPTFTDSAYMKFLSFFDKPYSPPLSVKLFNMDKKSLDSNTYIANWATENGVSVLNPWNTFCDSIKCTRYENNMWLYYDLHHLTIYGADKLRPLFIKAVLETSKIG